MCEPTTLASIGIGIGVLGLATSMSAQASATRQQGDVLSMNEALARRAEKASVLTGAAAAAGSVEQGSRVIGEARATASGSGVDVQSPGVLNILDTTRETAAMDAETIKNNALREALGYSIQATSFGMQSRMNQLEGRNRMIGTAIQGAGGITEQLYRMSLLNQAPSPVYQAPDYLPIPGYATGSVSGYPSIGKGG